MKFVTNMVHKMQNGKNNHIKHEHDEIRQN